MLLQVLAFTMILNHSWFHQSLVSRSLSSIVGSTYKGFSGVTEYFHLSHTNQQLAEENARLRQQLQHLLAQADPEPFNKTDTVFRMQYQVVPATVVSNTVNLRNNYLMLNKGRRHGIREDMAVISSEGVVGVVVNVSQHFSWVMSLLNSNSMLNVRLNKSDHHGSVTWPGGNYRLGRLNYIPTHVTFASGDTLVTGGHSLIFPPGVSVGTVEDYHIGKEDHFFTVSIKYAVDFNRLTYVYIVKNMMRQEQLSVIEKQ